ncbi:MAG TPA: glycosyltransferase [Burkholderiales bacterium]|nr:glycosyltransferase [Burkholderiales bacterium]
MAVPRVTVLMAVRDGAPHLDEAVRSVIAQSFADWEFVIVDDGSTDDTAAILERYRRADARIRVVPQPRQGLAESLNRGLRLARGSYVARMDADDVSDRERLAVQVAAMDAHPEVGVCGSWIETFGMGPPAIRRYPLDDASIRSWLLFESVLAHPSVMIRRDVLERHGLAYDAAMLHAEDYDLWVRAARVTKLANVPQVLLRYREHSQQVVRKHDALKRQTARRIRAGQLTGLGLSPSEEELDLHETISLWSLAPARESVAAAHAWLLKLIEANRASGRYPQAEFGRVVAQRWSAICAGATRLGPWTLQAFWRSPLRHDAELSRAELLKFSLRCALRR